MMPSVLINFTSNMAELLDHLKVLNTNDFQISLITVNEIPTIGNAVELISQESFKSEFYNKNYPVGAILRINEKITKNTQIYKFETESSILFAFRSTVEDFSCKIYWKVPGCENTYSLLIDEDPEEVVGLFCIDFLMAEMKNGNKGILRSFHHKTSIRLREIGDCDQSNLLSLAVAIKQPNLVHHLLLTLQFDSDLSIDAAWKIFIKSDNDEEREQCSLIILQLLRSNSRLPFDFDYEKAPVNVKKFVDSCEELHTLIEKNDLETLNSKLAEEPNLTCFYNRRNQSLLAQALERRKLKISDFLNRGLNIGSHENLDNAYEFLYRQEKKKISEIHQLNAKVFPDLHVLTLIIRSGIVNNDTNAHKRWELIEEAYTTLNSNKLCSKILKVAAEFKKLKIFFDFRHDTTYYLDPATSSTTYGVIYSGGTIFIGAKLMLDDVTKLKVFGVLAHELCHLAVYVSFMNPNFDPFPMGESLSKLRYVQQVMVECREMQELEPIIGNVFKSYYERHQNSEMIVTVPQMLMHYHGNEEKIRELRGIFTQLFSYVEDVVEPELDKAVSVLRILEDEQKAINLEALTEPMKAKLLHSIQIFQGQETSIFSINGDDLEVLKLLSVDDYRKVLIKNEELAFGDVCKLSLKYGLIERTFVKCDQNEDEDDESTDQDDELACESSEIFQEVTKKTTASGEILEQTDFNIDENKVKFAQICPDKSKANKKEPPRRSQKPKKLSNITLQYLLPNSEQPKPRELLTFKQILSSSMETKFFLLSDHAGAGKSTTFKYFTIELKKLNKDFWVSFVNLRKCGEIFEKFTKNSNFLTVEKICELLMAILIKDDKNFEKIIFRKLFFLDKIILLFDGIDEVTPKYTNLMLKALQILKNFTKIQVWISTRPHCIHQLVNVLQVPAYEFSPYTENDTKKFIKSILASKNIRDEFSSNRRHSDLIYVHASGILFPPYFESRIGYNPLIIQIITELYIESEIELGFENVFEIFRALVERQKNVLGDKVPNEDRDKICKLSVWDVHNILALIVIVDDDLIDLLGFKLEELAIMRKWTREKSYWTSETIQRYGFVVVVFLENFKVDRSLIDFVHRVFAEFFIAKFFIDFIFDDHSGESDEEMQKLFKIFDVVVMSSKNKFTVVSQFFSSYVRKLEYVQNFDDKIKNLMIEKFSEIHKNLKKSVKQVKSHKIDMHFYAYAYIARFDESLSEKLWGLDKGTSVIRDLCMKVGNGNYGFVTSLAELCFGSDWHLIFYEIMDWEMNKEVSVKNKSNIKSGSEITIKTKNLEKKSKTAANKIVSKKNSQTKNALNKNKNSEISEATSPNFMDAVAQHVVKNNIVEGFSSMANKTVQKVGDVIKKTNEDENIKRIVSSTSKIMEFVSKPFVKNNENQRNSSVARNSNKKANNVKKGIANQSNKLKGKGKESKAEQKSGDAAKIYKSDGNSAEQLNDKEKRNLFPIEPQEITPTNANYVKEIDKNLSKIAEISSKSKKSISKSDKYFTKKDESIWKIDGESKTVEKCTKNNEIDKDLIENPSNINKSTAKDDRSSTKSKNGGKIVKNYSQTLENSSKTLVKSNKCDKKSSTTVNKNTENYQGASKPTKFNTKVARKRSFDEESVKLPIIKFPNHHFWKESENLLKLCHLVEFQFTSAEKIKFYSQLNINDVENNKTLKRIVVKMQLAFNGKAFASKCMNELDTWQLTGETITFIYEEVEKALNYDRNDVRSYIFNTEYPHIFKIYRTNNVEVFRAIRKFCTKYKDSWQEIEDLFMTSSMYDFLKKIESSFFDEYKDFIQEIFAENPSRMAERIDKYCTGSRFGLGLYHKYFENFKDFLGIFFKNNVKKVEEILEKTHFW